MDTVIATATPEVRAHLVDLRDQVRVKRRRSWWLAGAAALAVLLGSACGGGYYLSNVYGYAELDPELLVRRDQGDRLSLVFRPTTSGKVGFRRTDVDRETELLDRVGADALGQQQVFQWRVAGLKEGDPIRVTFRKGAQLLTRQLTVPALGQATGDGKATLSGQIVNAINKQPVPGAEVRVVGTSLAATADAKGLFRLEEVPAGKVPVEVASTGFTSERFDRTLSPGEEQGIRVVLSPGLKAGQIRIVLTWDKKPEDLDAHLEGPLPDGSQFHVYYHQQGDLKSKEFVRLDVDDQDGEGPETITVLGTVPGTYRYYVHDYTNRDDSGGGQLAASGAKVKVYQSGQTHPFTIDPAAKGNIWNVCTIEVKGQEAVVHKTDTFESKASSAMGLYAKRTQANRSAWIGRYGGSVTSEESVAAALDWLARHQAPDGSWSNRNLGPGSASCCDQTHPCTGPGKTYEMAHTGLAVLAFQAGGHYHFNENKYSENVRKGLNWMVEHQRAEGGLIGTAPLGGYKRFHKNYLYEHGIAAFALAEALALQAAEGRGESSIYRDAVERAIGFIYANQLPDGGWRYSIDPDERGDTSVSGWQVLALKSAKEAGIGVPPERLNHIRRFFAARLGEDGRTGYQNTLPSTEATTGVGMIARQFLLDEADSPVIRDAALYLARHAEEKWGDRQAGSNDRDFYLWYNCTLGMYQAGGEPWERWNAAVRDTIIGLQRHDGCERGSWDDAGRWTNEGGRIFTTALAALTLQVYYRYAGHFESEGDGGVVTLIEPVPSDGKKETPLHDRGAAARDSKDPDGESLRRTSEAFQ